jgi:hypothetical protein
MAIVDTGTDKTYLGAKGFQLCQSLNVQIQKHPNVKIVQLAGKSTATILGSVELPIVFENNTHLVTCNILPNLCTDLILGLDSSYKMELVINTAIKFDFLILQNS